MPSNPLDASLINPPEAYHVDRMPDMEIALLLLGEMKMPQVLNEKGTKPEITEAFLKHAEKTAELMENPYAKSLLKEAIEQIRKNKIKNAE